MQQGRSIAAVLFAVAWLLILVGRAQAAGADGAAPLPRHLAETGLFDPGRVDEVAPGAVSFTPQYPLWSDGSTKRRWIALPPGTSIDASNPDAWQFPAGTRLWKEFSVDGRRVETRYIERLTDGTWRYATYVWNEAGTDATLAPTEGIAAFRLTGTSRAGTYAVPGEYDCRACHEGATVPVLGFGALQLSPDRDPLAPHAGPSAVDLRVLVARGLLRNLPPQLLVAPPRIAARTPTARAALGYLHGNCGHCHSAPTDTGSAVPVGLVLAQSVAQPRAQSAAVLRSLVDAASRYRPRAGTDVPTRLAVPGHSQASVLPLRMRSRDPRVQMPPLGTTRVDTEAVALIERWIDNDLQDSTVTQTQEEKSSWNAME